MTVLPLSVAHVEVSTPSGVDSFTLLTPGLNIQG